MDTVKLNSINDRGDWNPATANYTGNSNPSKASKADGVRASNGQQFYAVTATVPAGSNPLTDRTHWAPGSGHGMWGRYCILHGLGDGAMQNAAGDPSNGFRDSVFVHGFGAPNPIRGQRSVDGVDFLAVNCEWVVNSDGTSGGLIPDSLPADSSFIQLGMAGNGPHAYSLTATPAALGITLDGALRTPTAYSLTIVTGDVTGLATSTNLGTSPTLATSGGTDRGSDGSGGDGGDGGDPPPPPPPPPLVPAPLAGEVKPGQLRYVVCDANGRPVGEALEALAPRELNQYRNGVASAKLVLSLDANPDTPEVEPLGATLFPDRTPRLKVYRDPSESELFADETKTSELEFYGSAPPETIAVDPAAGTVTATFFDPLYALKFRYSRGEAFVQVDEGLILWGLVDSQNKRPGGDTWIRQGSLTTGTLRDRTYDRRPVLDLFDELSKVVGGPDFGVDPFDGYENGGSRAMAALRVFPEQGNDLTDVHFVYGDGLPSNVENAAVSYLPVVTEAEVVGANTDDGFPLDSVYTKASTSVYGLVEAYESDSDVSTQDTVDEKASSIVENALTPRLVVALTNPTAEAPKPWESYRLGDTVYVTVRRGAFFLDRLPVRVDAIEVSVDANGVQSVRLTVSASPE
jgi:hypothetical protein